MGETVRWAQNCLRIFELIKSVNGKGIHSGPIFSRPSSERFGLENLPQETDYPQKIIFLKCLWMCPTIPPRWQETDLTNGSSPVPAGTLSLAKLKSKNPSRQWDPQLSKAEKQKPVPTVGTLSFAKLKSSKPVPAMGPPA